MSLNLQGIRDFIAMDLIDSEGEYSPQFDAFIPYKYFIQWGSKIDIDTLHSGLELLQYYGDAPVTIRIPGGTYES